MLHYDIVYRASWDANLPDSRDRIPSARRRPAGAAIGRLARGRPAGLGGGGGLLQQLRRPADLRQRAGDRQNPTIRQLWPLWQPLRPPAHGETVTNRPLLNLSLALNYAVGGLATWGYHAVNLAIHLAAALLLFGIVRRTLRLPAMRDRWGQAATGLALAVALLWAVHPLQTESVTYIVQRAESLAGMLYLLVLYGLIRARKAEKGTHAFGRKLKRRVKRGRLRRRCRLTNLPLSPSPPLPSPPSPGTRWRGWPVCWEWPPRR